MRLSLSKKFLFIHIPKTAGGSVSRLLLPDSVKPSRTVYRRLLSHLPIAENPLQASFPVHSTAQWARLKLGDELFAQLYKFAFVRNPFDLMVSRYEYIRQTPQHHKSRSVAELSFPQFVRAECTRPFRRIEDQCHFILSRDGRLLVDDIYRFESFDAELRRLCTRLGVEPPEALPHRHKTERRHYREYYSAEDRRIVARAFARDIERFGYAF